MFLSRQNSSRPGHNAAWSPRAKDEEAMTGTVRIEGTHRDRDREGHSKSEKGLMKPIVLNTPLLLVKDAWKEALKGIAMNMKTLEKREQLPC